MWKSIGDALIQEPREAKRVILTHPHMDYPDFPCVRVALEDRRA